MTIWRDPQHLKKWNFISKQTFVCLTKGTKVTRAVNTSVVDPHPHSLAVLYPDPYWECVSGSGSTPAWTDTDQNWLINLVFCLSKRRLWLKILSRIRIRKDQHWFCSLDRDPYPLPHPDPHRIHNTGHSGHIQKRNRKYFHRGKMIFLMTLLRFTPDLRHIRRFRPWNYSRRDCIIRLPWKSALDQSITLEGCDGRNYNSTEPVF